jgi:hypothetical protein
MTGTAAMTTTWEILGDDGELIANIIRSRATRVLAVLLAEDNDIGFGGRRSC